METVDVNLRGARANGHPIWTPFVTNIDYNAKGQRTLIQYANGAATTYDYDDKTFRLTHLKTTRAAGQNGLAAQIFTNAATVQDLRYTYDPVGNITEIADAALQTVFNGNQVDPVCRYTYDALYRLTEATGREHIGQSAFALAPLDGNYRDYPFAGAAHKNDLHALRTYTERYKYDPVGNFDKMFHLATAGNWTRAYTYNESSLIEPVKKSNRLSQTALQTSGNPPAEPYSYDAHCDITQMPHLPVMQWDFKDQLGATSRQVVNTGAPETTSYVYGAGGQRARKITERQNGARKNERFYLGGFEIYREYAVGSGVKLERATLHVMDDKQRIALIETQTIDNGSAVASPTPAQRYQLGNHLGSASLELDETGALISYEEYSPYGSTAYQAGRSAAEVSLKRYRYTGKERDEENGFTYHGARYYAPWLGLWISVDPKPSLNASLFRYAANNPVKLRDPEGTDPQPSVGATPPSLGDLGLRRQDVVSRYSEPVLGVREGWQYLSQKERQESLLLSGNAELRAGGVPTVDRSGRKSKTYASFDRHHWKIEFGPKGSLEDNPTNYDFAQFTAAVLHELRHAEQHFYVARYLAGQGLSASQIANRLQIPVRVARGAFADPLPSGGLAAEAASLFYRSRHGSDARDTENVLKKITNASEGYPRLIAATERVKALIIPYLALPWRLMLSSCSLTFSFTFGIS